MTTKEQKRHAASHEFPGSAVHRYCFVAGAEWAESQVRQALDGEAGLEGIGDGLTPEEQKARDYLVKRYGPDIECVPEHWVKAVAGYAAERASFLTEQIGWATVGMVDAFRRRDYRAMWEIWNKFISNLKAAGKEAGGNGKV